VRGEDVYVLHTLHGPGGQSAADRLCGRCSSLPPAGTTAPPG
jgi:hypothetical protein